MKRRSVLTYMSVRFSILHGGLLDVQNFFAQVAAWESSGGRFELRQIHFLAHFGGHLCHAGVPLFEIFPWNVVNNVSISSIPLEVLILR